MSSLVPLDGRQALITRHLLAEAGPESVEEIATALRLTVALRRLGPGVGAPARERACRRAGV